MSTFLFDPTPAQSSRDRILSYLQANGGRITSADGCNLTAAMAEGAGYSSITALNAMLARMERDGLIERQVRGKRTFAVALTKEGRAETKVVRRQRRDPVKPATQPEPRVTTGHPLSDLLRALGELIASIENEHDEIHRRLSAVEELARAIERRSNPRNGSAPATALGVAKQHR